MTWHDRLSVAGWLALLLAAAITANVAAILGAAA